MSKGLKEAIAIVLGGFVAASVYIALMIPLRYIGLWDIWSVKLVVILIMLVLAPAFILAIKDRL